jgi:ATP-dependent helicase HepA
MKNNIPELEQVLNDKNQKYLLGDEVGLGKTIEAGFLIKEHILDYKENSCIFVLWKIYC